MISRYETPLMAAIWSRVAKYERWKEVEIAVCRGWNREGLIPDADLAEIESRASFTLARCDELERTTRHDLVAFVRNLEETTGPAGRWIHYGVTSYDVIDTALALMLRESFGVLASSGERLRAAIEHLAETHIATPQIGRTHAIHAEPITFGFKCAGWLAELDRNLWRLRLAGEDLAVGKISGAVGIHGVVSPEMEREVLAELGLRPDAASTQIVNRDRLAHGLSCVALLGAGLERIATELRNLQRTEIREVQEAFAAGQTGSSAMPHKRNPWNSETICGLARLLRANAHAMMESVATWHERDLTNSSLERVILPDTFHLADFMLGKLATILGGLVVDEERMSANLRLMGDLVFSEHLMVALVASGLSREAAYAIAQRHAAAAWDGASFQAGVRADPEVNERLSSERLDEVFSLEHHLRHAAHTISAVKAARTAEDSE